MAFSGAPPATPKQISDRRVRIFQPGEGPESAFALQAGATGTIGLFGKTAPANITLPEGFKPGDFKRAGADVSLQDSIDVKVRYLGNAAVRQPVNVVKTGTTPEDFQIALTNSGNATTGLIEIFVEYH